MNGEPDGGNLRLAELMAALSLATDLGMGQPLEQALRTCMIALRLAALAKVPTDEFPAVYYGALLRFLGCTADAHETAALTGNDIAFRQAGAPVLGAAAPELMRGVLPALGKGRPGFHRVRHTAGFLVRGLPTLRAGVKAHCEVGDALAAGLGLSQGSADAYSRRLNTGMARGFRMACEAKRSPQRLESSCSAAISKCWDGWPDLTLLSR